MELKNTLRLLKTFSMLFICLLPYSSFAQEIDIIPYIKAWKSNDKSQTFQFDKTKSLFTDVHPRDIKFTKKYLQVIDEAKKHLQKNPDNRVEIRLLMYEIWVDQKFKKKVDNEKKKRLFESISKSYTLKDEQLLSEIYILYANINRSSPEYIIYNSKAIRIQEKIGIEYFPGYCGILFGLCNALYHTNNFSESLIYGENFIACTNNFEKELQPGVYVFWLDLMGANHHKLREYDKAYDYFDRLLKTLEDGENFEENFRISWQGIGRLSIGTILFEQGQTEESIPYLQSALKIALDKQIWNTAAGSQNILAEIDYNNGYYETALKKWKEAYQWLLKAKHPTPEPLQLLKYRISANIAKAYHKTNDIDSTFYYQNKANKEQLEYENSINERNFNVITTNLNFEEATNKLEISHHRLQSEKTLRNGILASVVLLGIITLLVIRQRQLRTNYRQQILIQEKEIAEQRTTEAKKNIENFRKNIAEKEQLIKMLLKNNKQDDEQKLNEKFSKYVLLTDEEWLRFKDEFSKAYPMFLSELRKIIHSPTPAEERLCCLISLNLSNAQIAAMLGISTDSVARSKRRLKKRIEIPNHILLEEHICNLHTL